MHFAAPGGNGYLLFSIIQEASYLVAFLLFHKLRHFLTAALHTLGAPSCQRTSCLVTNWAGDIPLQHNSLLSLQKEIPWGSQTTMPLYTDAAGCHTAYPHHTAPRYVPDT